MASKRLDLSLFKLFRAGIKGSQTVNKTGHPLPTIYGVLRRWCRSKRPSLLSEKDTRKLGSVVKANRRHPVYYICAICNDFRPRIVSK